MIAEERTAYLISIHALRGESDTGLFIQRQLVNISIHALRGESDRRQIHFRVLPLYFNPRSPWGERLLM